MKLELMKGELFERYRTLNNGPRNKGYTYFCGRLLPPFQLNVFLVCLVLVGNIINAAVHIACKCFMRPTLPSYLTIRSCTVCWA